MPDQRKGFLFGDEMIYVDEIGEIAMHPAVSGGYSFKNYIG